MTKFLLLLVAALVAAAFGADGFEHAARAQDAPPATPSTASAPIWRSAAVHCHGRAGQGGAMNYPAPPLAKTEMPFEGFKMVVRESMRDMPAYDERRARGQGPHRHLRLRANAARATASQGYLDPQRLIGYEDRDVWVRSTRPAERASARRSSLLTAAVLFHYVCTLGMWVFRYVTGPVTSPGSRGTRVHLCSPF